MSINTPRYGAGFSGTEFVSNDQDRSPRVAKSTGIGTSRAEIWARIWFVLAIGTLAYFVPLSDVGRAAFAGSQSVYLVVAPVLAGLVAAGYVRAPRGVGDSESDWIGAVILAVAGFAAMWLIDYRLPTMAALWRVDNVGLLIWVVATGMVVFSARHILRMWHVWLVGLLLAPVMPFMLVTAQFGGSDTAIAMVAAIIGTLAVFLATRFADLRWRLLGTAATLALSTGTVVMLADATLYLRVILAAGAVPLLVVLAAHRFVRGDRSTFDPATQATLPRRRPHTYVTLVVAALAMLWVHLPVTKPLPVEEVPSDWIATAALNPVEDFSFISRFLGAGATLTRYQAPGGAGEYPTVVDVMTSPNLARLQDFSDAVWYPSSAPVNYSSYDAGPDAPVGIQTAHSDADAAETQSVHNWNAVTWIWRAGNSFQRVTVITSQTKGLPAPSPRPISAYNVVVEPALWMTRALQLQAGVVDPIVLASTKVVVQRLLSSGQQPKAVTATS
ncbi:hypothetical protein BH11ACT6_BH11ACT6_46820 [soil metagenome]